MRYFLFVVGVCLFFKLQCFASLCFIKCWEMWIGILWGHLSLDIGLLACFSCMWIACGRGGDGKAASSLLALFQHRFCTDPSVPYKARSRISNGVHKSSSWPATFGGSLTLCRDVVVLLHKRSQREWKAKVRKEGRRCQLLQCCCAVCRGLDRWNWCSCYLVFICVPPSSTKQQKKHGLSWCFVQALNITLPPHLLEQ